MGDTSDIIDIIFQDEYLIAINKPHGLLVHRSPIAKDATEFALQLVRNRIKKRVHLIHRLDRKTSGVLLLGLNPVITAQVQEQFLNHQVQKEYIAIVRGIFPQKLVVDYPLTNDRGKKQEAITEFECLVQSEIPLPHGNWKTSRYSLIRAIPKTGRQHQIRKHLAHLRHPIIGDRPYGCNKQNKLFKERWNLTRMMLHAQSLEFMHPITQQKLTIKAQLSDEFNRMKNPLGF